MIDTTFNTTIPDYRKLVTNLNYNFAESPSTQQYHQVAAHDNPDYAQAIGDIYRWGDVNRANFNLDLDYITDLNNKQYLDSVQKEQRAYAEKLRNEQRAYNEKQQAKAWARADAQRKQDRMDRLNDQKFNLALKLFDKQQRDPRNIAGFTPYRTNNTNINLDLDALQKERQDLIDTGNNLFSPENLTGNSLNEMLYNALVAEKRHQQAVKDYEAKASQIRSNYQEDLLRNAANNSYLTGTQNLAPWNHSRASNYLSNTDDRSYAAKLISENPFLGLTNQSKEAKAENLQDFMYDFNALDTGGWLSDEYNQNIASELTQSGYDITTMAPLISYSPTGDATDYVFDAKDGTVYEIGINDQTNTVQLVPIRKVDNLQSNSLSRLFRNLGDDANVFTRAMSERPENFGE